MTDSARAMVADPEGIGRAEWDEWEHPRCDICGKFCTPADAVGSWGSAGDDEPPEPVTYCPKCADELYQRLLKGLIERGVPFHRNRPYYGSPLAWHKAVAVVRGKRKHGLLAPVVRHERVRHEFRNTHPMVRWCLHCKRPEAHPAHDLREAIRLRTRHCKYQQGVGRWITPGYIREWCACGWATPWCCNDDTRNDWAPEDRPWWATGASLADYLIRQHLDEQRVTQRVR